MYVEEQFIWSFLTLALVAAFTTLFQSSPGPWLWLVALLPMVWFLKQKRKLSWPPVSATYGVFFVGLFVWVSVSGYYPERDNDAVSFLAAKAKALSLFGYLPQALPRDTLYTINHNYPLGFLVLSGALHSFLNEFSIFLHRFTLAFQSCIVFAGLYRFFRREGAGFADLLMILLVGVQPSIWANGYHDALWALALSLGWAYALFEKNFRRALPWIIFGSLGKVEAQILTFLSLPLIVIFTRRPIFFVAALPALLWFGVARYLNLPSTRQTVLEPYPFMEVMLPLWEHTKQLLLFKTHYGATSVGLWCAILLPFYLKKIPFSWSLAILGLTVFIAAYFFSNYLPDWNIRFSWPRILLYPIIVALVLGFAEAKKHPQKFPMLN